MTKTHEIFDAPPDGFAMAPVHPSEVLQEEIAARGLTAHALGLKLRAPANRLTEIIAASAAFLPIRPCASAATSAPAPRSG